MQFLDILMWNSKNDQFHVDRIFGKESLWNSKKQSHDVWDLHAMKPGTTLISLLLYDSWFDAARSSEVSYHIQALCFCNEAQYIDEYPMWEQISVFSCSSHLISRRELRFILDNTLSVHAELHSEVLVQFFGGQTAGSHTL